MERTLVAFNRAVDHPNLVHDPQWARGAGFRGGLVPGVDVFGYVASVVTECAGPRWLERGALEARFLRPVCDGDTVAVHAEPEGAGLAVTVRGIDGEPCATGRAELRHADPSPDSREWPWTPPRARLPAEPAALAGLEHLGSLRVTVSEAEARRQLDEIRAAGGYFERERIVHPGHLLRFADAILAAGVDLPPWMHVSSRARLFGTAAWDSTLEVRARKVGLFEKRGHRFIQLDVLVSAGGRAVMRVQPYTAIYDPAWNRPTRP